MPRPSTSQDQQTAVTASGKIPAMTASRAILGAKRTGGPFPPRRSGGEDAVESVYCTATLLKLVRDSGGHRHCTVLPDGVACALVHMPTFPWRARLAVAVAAL